MFHGVADEFAGQQQDDRLLVVREVGEDIAHPLASQPGCGR
jgi:hypothetical protein